MGCLAGNRWSVLSAWPLGGRSSINPHPESVRQGLPKEHSNDEKGDCNAAERELAGSGLVQRGMVTGPPGVPDDEQNRDTNVQPHVCQCDPPRPGPTRNLQQVDHTEHGSQPRPDQANTDQPPGAVDQPRQLTRPRPSEDVEDQRRHERPDRERHQERVPRVPRRAAHRGQPHAARPSPASTDLQARLVDAFIDEIPAAYKDIDRVMADAADLVEIRHTLRQVVNVKGD